MSLLKPDGTPYEEKPGQSMKDPNMPPMKVNPPLPDTHKHKHGLDPGATPNKVHPSSSINPMGSPIEQLSPTSDQTAIGFASKPADEQHGHGTNTAQIEPIYSDEAHKVADVPSTTPPGKKHNDHLGGKQHP